MFWARLRRGHGCHNVVKGEVVVWAWGEVHVGATTVFPCSRFCSIGSPDPLQPSTMAEMEQPSQLPVVEEEEEPMELRRRLTRKQLATQYAKPTGNAGEPLAAGMPVPEDPAG